MTMIIDARIKLKTVVNPYDISKWRASLLRAVFAKCTEDPKIVNVKMVKNSSCAIIISSSSDSEQNSFIRSECLFIQFLVCVFSVSLYQMHR